MDAPRPTSNPSERWVLKAVFGASAFAFVAFWCLMLYRAKYQAEDLDMSRCYEHQRLVHAGLTQLLAREGQPFEVLLRAHGKGANVGPLFPLMLKQDLLEDPPPFTSSCRSWGDYTVADSQYLRLSNLACRMHGRDPERPHEKADP